MRAPEGISYWQLFQIVCKKSVLRRQALRGDRWRKCRIKKWRRREPRGTLLVTSEASEHMLSTRTHCFLSEIAKENSQQTTTNTNIDNILQKISNRQKWRTIKCIGQICVNINNFRFAITFNRTIGRLVVCRGGATWLRPERIKY